MNFSTETKVRISRIGMAAKGVVYCLIGGLTFWGAFSYIKEKTGSEGMLKFLADQPLGDVMLWLIVVGLAAYVFWRLYQSIWDPSDIGNSLQGYATRIGCLSSGVFYAALMFTTLQIIFGVGSGGGGQELYIRVLLNQEYGRWMVAGVAVGFLANAIFQLYLAISGDYRVTFDVSELDRPKRIILTTTGILGYASRSIVIGLIAYLTLKAALEYNASEAGGTDEAFMFVKNQFGNSALIVIAAGLFAYGLFMIFKAKERKMNFD